MDIFSLFNFSYLEWVIVGSLLLFFLIQLYFYLGIYKKPYSCQKRRKKDNFVPESYPAVSVIIVAKNESMELKKNLPFILNQDYPDFEVIVVNSGSTDESDMVVKSFQQNHSSLYLTFVPAEAEGINSKKLALTLGIKAAKNDILLFTEAYCKPASDQWIKEVAKEFNKGFDIVLGFCKLRISKKTAMRGFILYDNLIHCLKYLSMALLKRPFMGIGRNLAYRKELFFNAKGFSQVLNVESGEDDLFINKITTSENTGVVISPESMTETDVVSSFKIWRSLKSKYIYAKQFHKGFSSYVFFWETFSKYMFYLLLIASVAVGIIFPNFILIGISTLLFVIRYVVQLVVINKNSSLFSAGKYHINLFFYDIFQPFNNLRLRKQAAKYNRFKK